MWWIYQCMLKYINTRMDGLYGFHSKTKQPSLENTNNTIVDEIFTHNTRYDANELCKMPEYMRNTIGEYGNEIYGLIPHTNSSVQNALAILRIYIESLHIPSDTTYHTYEDILPFQERNSIHTIKYSVPYSHISECYPEHNVKTIDSMNEIYVSAIGSQGSDRVFETPHIDGFFAWLPWCRVLRCVVAIQGNRAIKTRFPLSKHSYTLETGEYLAFDYNRSLHYIYGNKDIQDIRSRMILKLHYIVYPEWLPGWVAHTYIIIHGKYNSFLRSLFVQSQLAENTPNENNSKRYIAGIINRTTTIYVKIFLVGLYAYKCIQSVLE